MENRTARGRRGDGYQAAERLYFATVLLRGRLTKQRRDLEARALVESALDVLTEPRHRNVLHGALARDATRLGDPAAGEQCLRLMSPRSDDLHIDTAYRITRAYVSTAQRDFDTALAVLGTRRDDVPIADGQDELAAVLRANALERLGRTEEAMEQLRAIMVSRAHHEVVGRIIAHNAALRLCPHTYPQVAQQMSSDVVASKSGVNMRSIFTAVMLLVVPILGLVVAAGVFRLVKEVVVVAGVALSVLTTGFMLWTVSRTARIRSRLKRTGVKGRATLIAAKTTGTQINDRHVIELVLHVQAPGVQPFRASHREALDPLLLSRLHPGMTLAVLLDPRDPATFVLDL